MINILIFLVLLFCYSCSTDKSVENQIQVIEDLSLLESRREFNLNENVGFVSKRVNDMDIINDSVLLIAYDKFIYSYDFNGNQLMSIGRKGRARGEYIRPGALAVYNNHIYVKCSSLQKIIEYGLEGQYIDEYSGFGNSCTDFVVENDCIYMYGMGNRMYIQTYDIKNRRIVSEYGKYVDSDELLHFNSIIDGVCTLQSGAMFVNSSTLQCYELAQEQTNLIFKLNDSKYIVDKNINAKELMSPPYDKAIEYVSQNSVVVGVGNDGNNIYIATENKDSNASNEFVKKNIRVYKVNLLQKKCTCCEIKYPENGLIETYTFNKNYLYYMMTGFDGKAYVVQLGFNDN